jgi:hypothetical protein
MAAGTGFYRFLLTSVAALFVVWPVSGDETKQPAGTQQPAGTSATGTPAGDPSNKTPGSAGP